MARRPPRPRNPKAIERSYTRFLIQVWRRSQRIISECLAPVLASWPEEDERAVKLDSITDTERLIRERILLAEQDISALIHSPAVRNRIIRYASRVNQFAKADLERVLAIDLTMADPLVASNLGIWVQRNVDLIESGIMASSASPKLRPSLLADVENLVIDAHRRGLRVEVLKKQLIERYEVSNSRASLIARDQVLKLNGQITKQRQTAAGITQYRWSTSKDEKVRPEHEALEGEIFSWSNPPPPGHPGEDFQCRCVAIPIIE